MGSHALPPYFAAPGAATAAAPRTLSGVRRPRQPNGDGGLPPRKHMRLDAPAGRGYSAELGGFHAAAAPPTRRRGWRCLGPAAGIPDPRRRSEAAGAAAFAQRQHAAQRGAAAAAAAVAVAACTAAEELQGAACGGQAGVDVLRGKWLYRSDEDKEVYRFVFDCTASGRVTMKVFSVCKVHSGHGKRLREEKKLVPQFDTALSYVDIAPPHAPGRATRLIESRGDGAFECTYYLWRALRSGTRLEGEWEVTRSDNCPDLLGRHARFSLSKNGAPQATREQKATMAQIIGDASGGRLVTPFGERITLKFDETDRLRCSVDEDRATGGCLVEDVTVDVEQGVLVVGLPTPWERRSLLLNHNTDSMEKIALLRVLYPTWEPLPVTPERIVRARIRAAQRQAGNDFVQPLVIPTHTEDIIAIEKLGFPPHERWGERLNVEWACKGLSGYGLFVPAHDGGKPVLAGWVCGYVKKEKGTGYLQTVQTHPSFCRFGIAVELLRRMAREFQERGVQEMELVCRATNDRAIMLYKKLGFQEQGRIRGGYSKPSCDAVFMKGSTLHAAEVL